jgi:hypothetical protein
MSLTNPAFVNRNQGNLERRLASKQVTLSRYRSLRDGADLHFVAIAALALPWIFVLDFLPFPSNGQKHPHAPTPL